MQKLLTVAYSSRVSATALSKLYNIDQNAVGRLLKYGEQQKTPIAQAVRKTRKRFKGLPYRKREVIYLDETFFRIAKQTWYLILVCDATGRVLSWKLSETRTAADVSQVLREVGACIQIGKCLSMMEHKATEKRSGCWGEPVS